MKPFVAFDHLVIGAQTLPQGAIWAQETLGAAMQVGGAHPFMGTHNYLGRLSQGFLEVIAIDPAGQKPAMPRWFGLDDTPWAYCLGIGGG